MTVPVTKKDLIIVNMGPHHLSMHGVLLLTLDGEDVIDCEPILGLGRGIVKITENQIIIIFYFLISTLYNFIIFTLLLYVGLYVGLFSYYIHKGNGKYTRTFGES